MKVYKDPKTYVEFNKGDKVLYMEEIYEVDRYSFNNSGSVAITQPTSDLGQWVFKKDIKSLTIEEYPELYI